MSTYYRRPRFSYGKLLRNEHLVALERQSFDFPALLFDGWGNGVISGCRLSTTMDTVTMGPGVVCFEGVLYGVQEPISVEYYPTDETRYLKLYIGSNEGNEACDTRRFTLKLSEQEQLGSGELELCRFRLQPGAYLRCNYTDFRDRETLYDTLNIIHSTYSAHGGDGLNPAITRAYAKEILRIGGVPDFDAAICISWLNANYAISQQVVQSYLKHVGYIVNGILSKQGLFEALLTRLEQLEAGSGQEQKCVRTGRKRILVD